tara:strand:- start:2049 stop:2414 length:366 start_codon:yes stop_codon:yes gene_type:complete
MTCLEDTYWYVAKLANKDDYTIIHSIVQRPSDGLRHPHSVVYNKKKGMILEVSNDFKNNIIEMPFMCWIKLGKVSNIIQYTFLEYNSKLLSTEKWDFWGLIEKNVLIVERGQAKYNYSLKI